MLATIFFAGFDLVSSLFSAMRVLFITLALVTLIVVCCAVAYIVATAVLSFVVTVLFPAIVIVAKFSLLAGGLVWVTM